MTDQLALSDYRAQEAWHDRRRALLAKAPAILRARNAIRQPFNHPLPIPDDVQAELGRLMARQHKEAFHRARLQGRVEPTQWPQANARDGSLSIEAADVRAEFTPQVMQLRDAGLTIEAIADEIGRSGGMVRRILADQGMLASRDDLRAQAVARAKRDMWILQAIDLGMARNAIARHIGISPASVSKAIHRAKSGKSVILAHADQEGHSAAKNRGSTA